MFNRKIVPALIILGLVLACLVSGTVPAGKTSVIFGFAGAALALVICLHCRQIMQPRRVLVPVRIKSRRRF